MVKVKNDIKILLTKYSKDVTVDDIGGELILYNNTELLIDSDNTISFLLENHIFSGIKLGYALEDIGMVIDNFYSENIPFTKYKDFIYIKKSKDMDLTDPIGIVKFVPKEGHWVGDNFYAHFIEINV